MPSSISSRDLDRRCSSTAWASAGAGSRSVPQALVASTRAGCGRLTAQIAPPGCSTWTVGSSRISRRNCGTVSASIQAAPSRASISSGVRSAGMTRAQGGDVDLERGSLGGGRARRASSLARTLPDRYSARGDEPAGGGVVEDQLAELARGPRSSVTPSSRAISSRSSSPRASRQIASASAGVSAPSAGLRGATTRAGEDRGLGGGLAGLVEVLQRVDERRRTGLRRKPPCGRGDAGQPLLAGRRVGAAGAAQVNRLIGPYGAA